MKSIHTLLILDRSGSMEVARDETILGFNEQVQTLRELQREDPDVRNTVTLVLFNHAVVMPQSLAPVDDAREISREDYVPSGTTALYDAIGGGVARVQSALAPDDRAVVVILTDGLENASREYTRASIAALISALESTGKWTFSFVGAGDSSAGQAVAINIDVTNTLTVSSSPTGISRSFDRMKQSRKSMAEKMRRGEDVRKGFFDD